MNEPDADSLQILENDDTMGAEGEEEKNDSPLREQVIALFINAHMYKLTIH